MIHIGIDIGKSVLTVATSDPAAPPCTWPVANIDLEDPAWWRHLRSHIPAGAIIVIEPTGTHYMTPIFTALTGLNCQLWLVNTTTTGKIRAVHISTAKSDRTDAQALALAATWIAQGRRVHGARPYGSDEVTATLRQLVNAHASATKTVTRHHNRLQQLAHALWPALAQHMPTYMKAIAVGAVLPDDVRDLAARDDLAALPGYKHHSARPTTVNPYSPCTATSAPCKPKSPPWKAPSLRKSKSPPWKKSRAAGALFPQPQTLPSLPCTSPRTDAPKT